MKTEMTSTELSKILQEVEHYVCCGGFPQVSE